MAAGSHNRALGLPDLELMTQARPAPGRMSALAEIRLRPSGYGAIWVATGLLFALSPLLVSGSVGSTALLSMLPFASILAIASIGQTLTAGADNANSH